MVQLIGIGTFSKACHLSIRTLRHYHDEGLLVPAEIDRATGYRRYHPDQLATALAIGRLRSLELSLPEVAAVLAASDTETVAGILKAHRARMEARLDATGQILAVVAELLGIDPPPSAPVVRERWAPPQLVASVRTVTPVLGLADVLAAAAGQLGVFLDGHGLLPAGPAGALYAGESFDETALDVEAFVPLAAAVPSDGRVAVRELPGQRLAVTVHRGAYGTIADAFAAVAAWIARHDRVPGGPLREVRLVGPDDTTDERELRTEVGWPVEPAPAPPPPSR
jgi:DNA-binding transcriptional MerR regulator/effector-binding domain-containing protein